LFAHAVSRSPDFRAVAPQNCCVVEVLRRLRIGTRVSLLSAVGLVLAAALVLTAIAGFATQTAAEQRTGSAMRLVGLVMEAKFRTADVAGWQTGYAFDFARGVPGALSDDVGQRKEFVASAAALKAGYEEIARAPMNASEQALLTEARQAFDTFMSVDDRIVAGYRTGNPASIKTADELASGESLDAFGKASAATSDLADQIRDDGLRSTEEAEDSARQGQRIMIYTGVAGLLLLLLAAYAIVRSIGGPLARLRQRLDEIADGDGDLRNRLPENGRDELSGVARSFNRFVSGIADAMRAVDEQSGRLAGRSEELNAISGELATSAAQTSSRAGAASTSAGQISSSVQTVAAGAEEMGASIAEIARSAGEAAQVAADAARVSATVTESVGKLGDSSRQIGEIAKVISAIAEQTNLLALNATIEAARAGEQGKGFAVVAGEVKELASDTARATGDIDRRIGAIQADTAEAVAAIARIAEVIDRINALQTTIASAIEEQTATTGEMSRTISDVAAGSAGITGDVTTVASAAEATSARVGTIREAAADLARVSSELRGLVGRFQY
jgi:methyl-accepting chemotaxis protein